MSLQKWTTKNGVKTQVDLSTKEIKNFIMQVNQWDKATYKKQYDIFKNKLRAYEGFRRAQGGKVETQSPVELLYKQAKAKKQFGADYTPSQQMQNIQSFTSISSGKTLTKALKSEKFIQARFKKYNAYVDNRFAGLIKSNEGAKAIADKYKDNPVLRERALSDYADDIKAKIEKDYKEQEGQVIPEGETFGSDNAFDDLSAYMNY